MERRQREGNRTYMWCTEHHWDLRCRNSIKQKCWSFPASRQTEFGTIGHACLQAAEVTGEACTRQRRPPALGPCLPPPSLPSHLSPGPLCLPSQPHPPPSAALLILSVQCSLSGPMTQQKQLIRCCLNILISNTRVCVCVLCVRFSPKAVLRNSVHVLVLGFSQILMEECYVHRVSQPSLSLEDSPLPLPLSPGNIC